MKNSSQKRIRMDGNGGYCTQDDISDILKHFVNQTTRHVETYRKGMDMEEFIVKLRTFFGEHSDRYSTEQSKRLYAIERLESRDQNYANKIFCQDSSLTWDELLRRMVNLVGSDEEERLTKTFLKLKNDKDKVLFIKKVLYEDNLSEKRVRLYLLWMLPPYLIKQRGDSYWDMDKNIDKIFNFVPDKGETIIERYTKPRNLLKTKTGSNWKNNKFLKENDTKDRKPKKTNVSRIEYSSENFTKYKKRRYEMVLQAKLPEFKCSIPCLIDTGAAVRPHGSSSKCYNRRNCSST